MSFSENKNVFSLAVIGGGASGLVAAISAARTAQQSNRKIKITVYEANSRVGKKILVTGNGRCNITNADINSECYFGSKDLFFSVYERFDNKALIAFLEELGLKVKTDFAGRVYPLSNQAASVLDVLRYELLRHKINIVSDTKITSVKKSGKGFLLNNEFFADACIVATGGKAAPVHGSDGSGFELLKPFNIKVTPIYPALTALCVENFTKALKGIRADGEISVKCAGKTWLRASGEIQYTEYGLSGIPSMQVSRAAAEQLSLNNGKDVFAVVDSAVSMTDEELKQFLISLARSNPDMPGEMLLAGLMPKRLGVTLMNECSLSIEKSVRCINPGAFDKLVNAVKHKKYKISSVKGFNDAQVTAGGISADEIDSDTLELKKIKGMYVCGEIVDVDGTCGGYNLQWAFSSGYLAGKKSVMEI